MTKAFDKLEQLDEHVCFGGRQLRFRHESATLHCAMNFSVYLPPQAEERPVPVLYWLSGLTCTDENFIHKAGAQQYAARHGIGLVAPDTSPRGDGVPDDPDAAYDLGLGAGFYVNSTREPWRRYYRMYDYVVEELPAVIGSTLPLDIDNAGIFGHSMGGHGALTIALRNPGRYRSVSAFAPISSPINCPWGNKALTAYLGDDRATWEPYDTCILLGRATTHLPVLIDQGDADGFLTEQLKTESLAAASEAAGYPMEIRMQAGYDHSYFFIASFMGDHLRFHADQLCEA